MKFASFRVCGIRSFADSGEIILSPGCNVFIGPNNVGKSTLIKSLLAFQGYGPFGARDFREGSESSFHTLTTSHVEPTNRYVNVPHSPGTAASFLWLAGGPPPTLGKGFHNVSGNHIFESTDPFHTIVPFNAVRKSRGFEENVSSGVQSNITGTHSNLYSRIDNLVPRNHPDNQMFEDAIAHIVGLPIATKASNNGKSAGAHFTRDRFITLDQMGDGVVEMLGIIAELCGARGKVFVIEEPETNVHPSGLKALMEMIRMSAEKNQFIITTHSNIVARELGVHPDTKLFRVFRELPDWRSPSSVEVVANSPEAHMAVMRELGYEFGDYGLFDGWLFLEEASAESIFKNVLIPMFAPRLNGRLRTFSAAGASKVEPAVADFQRLMTFIHLQPAYRGKIWIRTDGDAPGQEAVGTLRAKFAYLDEAHCATFSNADFESFYPPQFGESAAQAHLISDKRKRMEAKAALAREVIAWAAAEPEAARAALAVSAAEPIALLNSIEQAMVTT